MCIKIASYSNQRMINQLPLEILEHIFHYVDPDSLLRVRHTCFYLWTAANSTARQLVKPYLRNVVYREHLRQCGPLLTDWVEPPMMSVWAVLREFSCLGCGLLSSQFVILDKMMSGVSCMQCIQFNQPLQLMCTRDALDYSLTKADTHFISSTRKMSLRCSPGLRLQDVQDIMCLKYNKTPKEWTAYMDATVQQRRQRLLQRAQQVGLPPFIQDIIQKRRRVFYGPERHFHGRNLDHLLVICCGEYNQDLVDMHLNFYYYQQTEDDFYYTLLQLAYHSLLQKLQLESQDSSWVSEDIFVPQLQAAMLHALPLLEQAGMCPVR